MNEICKEAEKLQTELVDLRRELHACAETGFELEKTVAIVERELKKAKLEPSPCGKCGLTVTVGEPAKGNVVLLRADMDGLPMYETTGEKFACKGGNMHACGHDMHTSMLLGAAKILKTREKKLNGGVKLLFQPAEEILRGASETIKAGALKEPAPQAALALHVSTGVDVPAGKVLVSTREICAPAADYFQISVKGKACHGSTPSEGIDALLASAQILLALQQLSAREQSVDKPFVLTVGKLSGGTAGNAIADFAQMEGTLRAYDEETRSYIKKRLKEIALSTARAFRASAQVRFTGGCPTMKNDRALTAFAKAKAEELLGGDSVIATDGRGGGSEDFAYFSHELPSTLLVLTAGEKRKGYEYPLHHPKTRFDESVLYKGSALFAYFAEEYLAKYCKSGKNLL